MTQVELMKRLSEIREELAKLSEKSGEDIYLNAHPDGKCMATAGRYTLIKTDDLMHGDLVDKLMRRDDFVEVGWEALA